MKIVVLDGYTLNPGDLSWDDLRALGPCDIYERTAPGELLSRSEGAELLLTNKTPLGPDEFKRLTQLKYIGILATGTNVVDLKAAYERGIVVTNVPAYGTQSVAQTTIALLLELTQQVGHHAWSVRQGRWSQCQDWCYWERPLVELAGQVMGIVGLGRIGSAVAALARALGMSVCASTLPRPDLQFVRHVDLETLFRESDVLSLHCPLTPQTSQLVNAQRLRSMKPTAFLLNTSRGQLIEEPALAAALNEGRLAGAGLDVLSTEPPPPDHPLLRARNCFITPHLAWATHAARSRLLHMAVANVRAFLAGTPQNVVN